MSSLIHVGADPELFVSRKGEIIPICGLLGGTKESPLPTATGAVQEDNVLAEFNIPPSVTSNQFVHNINTVMEELESLLDEDMRLVIRSSHTFDKRVLLQQGDQAMEFGCEPDTNCWSDTENPHPNPDGTCLRTAGGHVHIGIEEPTYIKSLNIARMCDYLLGVPSVLLDRDTERRSLYGKAGACRVKQYGVEYRVLSNFWLANDKLKSWVFDQATAAVVKATLLPDYEKVASHIEVARIINESDFNAALKLCVELDISYPKTEVRTDVKN